MGLSLFTCSQGTEDLTEIATVVFGEWESNFSRLANEETIISPTSMLCPFPYEVSCYYLSDPNPWLPQRAIFAPGNQRKSIMKIKRKKCSSVNKSCLTLCNPVNCSTPGFPVLHHLPEFAQTHAQWVSDAIQPSHPLSSPSPLALNFSQYHGLFQWVSSSHQGTKILEKGMASHFSILVLRTPWMNIL